MDNKEVTFCW